MHKKIFFVLILTLPLFSISYGEDALLWEDIPFDSVQDRQELAKLITSAMSDEQALAQTFMMGWIGVEPSPLILRWIREHNIGGVKVFGWNTDDTNRLAETIGIFQNTAMEAGFGIPLLIATDQEGGMVRHVKGNTSETPGNMAIGAAGRPIDAYWSGYFIGRELSVLGINMNFAPTVDVFNNRDSLLIGPRSFGADPLLTAILGAAFAQGLREAGIIATAKHFPGHGDTALDSHGVLPRINISMETLWERELLPYRFIINEGIPAIMSGHLAFPNSPGGSTPASLSPWFLTELLRDELGFNGIIVTDDLMMGGALNYTRSLPLAARRALEAGNDILMLSSTPGLNDAIWTYLLASMREEPEFNRIVREACQRILVTKLEYFAFDNAAPLVPDLALLENELPHPEGSSFFMSLAARSTTILINDNILPLNSEAAGRVLLAGNNNEFFNMGRIAFPGARSYWYPSAQTLGDLTRQAQNIDTVILFISGRLGAGAIEQLRNLNARLIILSALNPGFLLDELSWAGAAVAVYSFAPESIRAGFSAILGRIPGEGRLPFILNGNQPASPWN